VPVADLSREPVVADIEPEPDARVKGAGIWGTAAPVAAPAGPKSWKIAVMAKGETKPSYNGCRYLTHGDADHAASNLFSRWMMMESWVVEESDDEPNQKEGLR